jgi:cytochrome c oxidase assembly factor CtaG
MFIYMLTPLYRASEINSVFHEFVHAYFLACGILLWWPLIRMDPTRWRPTYRVQVGIILAGIPLYVLLAVLIAAEGQFISPAHSPHQIRVGALILGVLGTTLSLLGLMVLSQRQRIRTKRRTRATSLPTASTGPFPRRRAPQPTRQG